MAIETTEHSGKAPNGVHVKKNLPRKEKKELAKSEPAYPQSLVRGAWHIFDYSKMKLADANKLHDAAVRILVWEGNGQHTAIAQQAAGFFAELLAQDQTLLDGQGNCGEIAAIVHGCATAAGYKARLLGGKVFRHDGRLDFGDGGHYWVEMPDGTIIDGVGTDTIRIHRPEQTGGRFIPILKGGASRPSVRAARGWKPLSKSVQVRIKARQFDGPH